MDGNTATSSTDINTNQRIVTETLNTNTGRLCSITDSTGNKTYFAYNDRGQTKRTWGDVPQPGCLPHLRT